MSTSPTTGRLSQKQFAARVGLSRQYVGRLVMAGRLPSLDDRSIPMPAGMLALEAIRAGGDMEETPVLDEPRAPLDPEAAAARAASLKLALDTREAALAGKAHRAKLLELQYLRERGELVPIADVRADATAAAESVRERLLAIPPRVASRLESIAMTPAGVERIAAVRATVADGGRMFTALEVLAILDEIAATRAPRAAAVEALLADEINAAIVELRSRFSEGENTPTKAERLLLAMVSIDIADEAFGCCLICKQGPAAATVSNDGRGPGPIVHAAACPWDAARSYLVARGPLSRFSEGEA